MRDRHAARGKIDLSWHKLSNVYRAPAAKARWRRARMEKCPDETYRQLWRLVDGGVRDTFANHPEYLTDKGRRDATRSIVKRVAGSIHGYATQVARGRSVREQDAEPDAAAEGTDALVMGTSPLLSFVRTMMAWLRLARSHGLGGVATRRRPKFDGDPHG